MERSRNYRLARVVGRAEHRPSLAESIPALALKDLRSATGSVMAVLRPRADATERRAMTVLESGNDPGPGSGGADRSGAWVFQANPKRVDLLAAMDDGPAEN